MFALRSGSFEDIKNAAGMLLVAFSLLNSRAYAHALMIQFGLFNYWTAMEHPVITLLEKCPSVLVGDNIELLNRLLAQHSMRSSRRSDLDLLNSAYTHLGIMTHHGMAMQEDIKKSINLDKGNT